jgi:predicted MFS family arabinose efflux permease
MAGRIGRKPDEGDPMSTQRHFDRHWEDWVNLLAGAWLACAPWVFGFADNQAAIVNAAVVGLALMLFATLALVWVQAWEEWLGIVLGLWLIASPWALGFADRAIARWIHVIIGGLVALIAVYEMWEELAARKHGAE